MATLQKPLAGFLGRSGATSDRATAAAFKVGRKTHKANGGATPLLKEVMRLYRENNSAE